MNDSFSILRAIFEGAWNRGRTRGTPPLLGLQKKKKKPAAAGNNPFLTSLLARQRQSLF